MSVHNIWNSVVGSNSSLEGCLFVRFDDGVIHISSDNIIDSYCVVRFWNEYVSQNGYDRSYMAQSVEIEILNEIAEARKVFNGTNTTNTTNTISNNANSSNAISNNIISNHDSRYMNNTHSNSSHNNTHSNSSHKPSHIEHQSHASEALELSSAFRRANSAFTMENFILGESNRFAFEAVNMLIKSIESGSKPFFNSLYISGALGVGKTHLGQAIINSAAEHNNLQYAYVSAESFMRAFANSSTSGMSNKFYDFFRFLNLLVIDDIQLIQGKWRKTQEEMVMTIDHIIHSCNGVVVFIASQHFSELDGIYEPLRSRLSAGINVSIEDLDYNFRVDFINYRIKKYNALNDSDDVYVEQGLIEYIAQNISRSVRELDSAINKVIIQASMYGGRIRLDDRIKDKLLKHIVVEKDINIDDIMKCVAFYYSVNMDDMISSSRKKSVSEARHVAIYFARVMTNHSLEYIGSKFGRAYTSILRSYMLIAEKIKKYDEKIMLDVQNIKKQLK